ncbi:MAG: ABC transporter ATP-binding protein [Lachnospiraceae bacterium]|nr:ABC transporter ATP-binding protein [Lachnospiraceae bacterium]
MIEIKNVSKMYFGSVVALADVSLTIGSGEIIGLFGENGAGKTTLMKSILGIQSFQGQILLDGEPITRKNIARLSFGTCEHSFFPNLTAAENAQFYKEHFPKYNEKRFNGLMEFFGLPAYRRVRGLSTGQQNQLEVILALSQGADYIFLDEPFAGNDIFNREDFYKVLLGIMNPNETIVLSTHLIEEVAGFIDRAVLIRRGHLVGDAQVADLEQQGLSLTDYVKQQYGYQSDRVSKALDSIIGGEEENA